MEDTGNMNSIGSSLSDKSVSEGQMPKHVPDSKIFPLKKFVENSKSGNINGSKQAKKSLKKIKQSSIKKPAKDPTYVNFASKVVSSVKNSSRVSYNKIFYSNKSKSNLKTYTNAARNYQPKQKKSACRESNNSTQVSTMLKTKKRLTTSSRNMLSGKKLHQTSESPCNNKSQGESSMQYIRGGLKNKFGRAISNQHIIRKKLSQPGMQSMEQEDTEYIPIHNQQDVT